MLSLSCLQPGADVSHKALEIHVPRLQIPPQESRCQPRGSAQNVDTKRRRAGRIQRRPSAPVRPIQASCLNPDRQMSAPATPAAPQKEKLPDKSPGQPQTHHTTTVGSSASSLWRSAPSMGARLSLPTAPGAWGPPRPRPPPSKEGRPCCLTNHQQLFISPQ